MVTTCVNSRPNNIAALAVIAGRHLLRALPAPAPFPDAMLDFDRAAACLGIVIISMFTTYLSIVLFFLSLRLLIDLSVQSLPCPFAAQAPIL